MTSSASPPPLVPPLRRSDVVDVMLDVYSKLSTQERRLLTNGTRSDAGAPAVDLQALARRVDFLTSATAERPPPTQERLDVVINALRAAQQAPAALAAWRGSDVEIFADLARRTPGRRWLFTVNEAAADLIEGTSRFERGLEGLSPECTATVRSTVRDAAHAVPQALEFDRMAWRAVALRSPEHATSRLLAYVDERIARLASDCRYESADLNQELESHLAKIRLRHEAEEAEGVFLKVLTAWHEVLTTSTDPRLDRSMPAHLQAFQMQAHLDHMPPEDVTPSTGIKGLLEL